LHTSSRSIARTPPGIAAQIEIWTGHGGERTWEATGSHNGCGWVEAQLKSAEVTVEAKSIATQLKWPCNAFSGDFQQVPSMAGTSAFP